MTEMDHAGRGELVILDVGGVLVRIRRGLSECAEAIGVSWADEPLASKDEAQLEALMMSYQSGLLELSAFTKAVSGVLDGRLSAAQVEHMHHEILVAPYEGAAELVSTLQCGGMRVGLLSNTCTAHWKVLEHYDAIALVAPELRFLSFELGMAKPAEAIFSRVEELSGYRGSEILFVDDGVEHVAAARAHGWRARQVEHAREGMDAVAEALSELGVVVD